jgi:hypothetical protein
METMGIEFARSTTHGRTLGSGCKEHEEASSSFLSRSDIPYLSIVRAIHLHLDILNAFREGNAKCKFREGTK